MVMVYALFFRHSVIITCAIFRSVTLWSLLILCLKKSKISTNYRSSNSDTCAFDDKVPY